jgi:hypothetical protein
MRCEQTLDPRRELEDDAFVLERLLEFAALADNTPSTRSVGMSQLVESEVHLFRPLTTERGITVHATIAPDVVVRCDPDLVHRLLDHLLAYAVRFTPPGGTVAVTLRPDGIQVDDSGPSLGDADLQYIFERFWRTERARARRGLGLGLAAAKRICEAHGWDISAGNKPTEGLSFVVRFDCRPCPVTEETDVGDSAHDGDRCGDGSNGSGPGDGRQLETGSLTGRSARSAQTPADRARHRKDRPSGGSVPSLPGAGRTPSRPAPLFDPCTTPGTTRPSAPVADG